MRTLIFSVIPRPHAALHLLLLAVLFLMTLVATFPASSQPATTPPLPALSDDTLAVVGTAVITQRDLLERLELMPWQGKERRGYQDSLKIYALQSLVAERLLSMEGAQRGLGRDERTALRIAGLERMLARDELYKREVRAKVVVREDQVREGLRRCVRDLRLLFVTTRSEESTRALAQQLRASRAPDSLLRSIGTADISRLDTLLLQFGVADTALENTAYALSKKQPVSHPVQTESFGTGILVLQGETPNRTMLQQSLPDRRRSVERTLRDREETLIGRAYLGTILSPQKAVVDPSLFDSLVTATRDVLLSETTPQKQGAAHDLTSGHVDAVAAKLRGHLRERLVTIGDDGMTLAEALEGFRNERFKFPVLTDPEFAGRMSGSLKMVVQQELMSREALRQGLQNSPDVRRDMSVWSSYWTARELEQQIASEVSVTDSEVTAFLVRGGSILGRAYEVNVREILSGSLEESLQMTERLLAGEDMRTLAREFSLRREWAGQGGESGFFRVSENPGLGFAALAQDSGTFGGPLHLPEGFSVFTVLGKRQVLNDSIPSYATLRENARRLVHTQQVQKSLNRFLADLATRQAITIDYTRLRRIPVIPSNMVTTRYIGFGGAMLAVPILHPQYRWVDEVPDNTGLIP